MKISVHGVQFADSKTAWPTPEDMRGSALGRATIRDGGDKSEVVLFFWSAAHCQQLADELADLAAKMRGYEQTQSTEDAGNDSQSE